MGWKPAAEPRVLFRIILFGYPCGICSGRKPEEACLHRVDFMRLPEDQKAPDHAAAARFQAGQCRDAAEDLFCRYVRKLEERGGTNHPSVFLDGSKPESRAGRDN